MRQQGFFDYMEALATNHKAINHNREGVKKRFARALLNANAKDMFGRINVDEVLAGLKTKLEAPMMVAIAYDALLGDAGGDNRQLKKTGAILLLGKPAAAVDSKNIIAVIDEMEQVAEEMLGYIDEDWQTGYETGDTSERLQLDLNECGIVHISGVKDGLAGVRIDLVWKEQKEHALAYNADRFNTPLPLSF